MTKATREQLERQIQGLSRALRHMDGAGSSSHMSLMTLNGALEIFGVDDGFLLTHNQGFFLTAHTSGHFTVRAALTSAKESAKRPTPPQDLLDALRTRVGEIVRFNAAGFTVIPHRAISGEWACLAFPKVPSSTSAQTAVETLLASYAARFQALVMRETQHTDTGCGALFHHAGLRKLSNTLRLGSRSRMPTSLVRIEIQNFQSLTDDYGIAAGAVMRRVLAQTILQNTRATDSLFCCGDGGYALTLPMTNSVDARHLAHAIIEVTHTQTVQFGPHRLQMNCRAGIAESDSGPADARRLLRAAQTNLRTFDELTDQLQSYEAEPMPMMISG